MNQTKFNSWEDADTPRPIEDGDAYAFPCPQCGMDYGGVHVAAVRIAPHGDRNRPSAQIALSCEQGCVTTVIIGNHKGTGYACWQHGADWARKAFGEDESSLFGYEDAPSSAPLPVYVPDLENPIIAADGQC